VSSSQRGSHATRRGTQRGSSPRQRARHVSSRPELRPTTKCSSLPRKRQTLVVRLGTLESNPKVPGGSDEQLEILRQLRATQPLLDGALIRAKIIAGGGVLQATGTLSDALSAVASSSAGFGAGVSCSAFLAPLFPFDVCSRFVDNSAPLDKQLLATPLVEPGELDALSSAVKRFTTEAAQELSAAK